MGGFTYILLSVWFAWCQVFIYVDVLLSKYVTVAICVYTGT